jgi:hypothetical protein
MGRVTVSGSMVFKIGRELEVTSEFTRLDGAGSAVAEAAAR